MRGMLRGAAEGQRGGLRGMGRAGKGERWAAEPGGRGEQRCRCWGSAAGGLRAAAASASPQAAASGTPPGGRREAKTCPCPERSCPLLPELLPEPGKEGLQRHSLGVSCFVSPAVFWL